ncbi:TPA: hypothetical protein N0F65_012354 [Lagenidium giganteum]|uniref:Lipoyl-binding domain-containing protein n=1 Tax=Lagenidium giganteum TaxID=4803 RepID=A0AAV2YNU5_9STRA|nr:TPA: hypothetical protein N0F65_012354 [Lagenidium giganteum]
MMTSMMTRTAILARGRRAGAAFAARALWTTRHETSKSQLHAAMAVRSRLSRFMSSKHEKLPKHVKFRMPDLDFEHVSGSTGGNTLAKWHVKEGQEVDDGDHLCEIETPDLILGLESGDEGYIAKILVPKNADVVAGQLLCVIVPKKDDVERFQEALEKHPQLLEGYASHSDVLQSDEESESVSGEEGAAVLRLLAKLKKDGHFDDDRIMKKLKSMARKNDKKLLRAYKGSFEDGVMEDSAFDVEFFVENAEELAEEALEKEDKD